MLMTKSIIFSKKNIRYFIIFIILLIVLFLLSITRIGITNKVYDIENEEIYRTIYVRFNSNIDINNIKDVTYIENMYLGNNNEYTIIFKEYNDIYRFIDNYSDTYKDISINECVTSETLNILSNILNIIIWIVSIITIILLILNIIEIILLQKDNMSFYKMFGFKNKIICRYIFIIMIITYTILFIISIGVSLIISFIIQKLFYTYQLVLNIIDIKLVIYSYLIIILVIFISICFIYNKIKKITPTEFRNIN